MRAAPLVVVAPAAALLLAACAGAGGETATSSYRGGEFGRLQRACDARGGILVPSGRAGGEPALDNVCSITGVSTPPP